MQRLKFELLCGTSDQLVDSGSAEVVDWVLLVVPLVWAEDQTVVFDEKL